MMMLITTINSISVNPRFVERLTMRNISCRPWLCSATGYKHRKHLTRTMTANRDRPPCSACPTRSCSSSGPRVYDVEIVLFCPRSEEHTSELQSHVNLV